MEKLFKFTGFVKWSKHSKYKTDKIHNHNFDSYVSKIWLCYMKGTKQKKRI
jgi:hypothetical protein